MIIDDECDSDSEAKYCDNSNFDDNDSDTGATLSWNIVTRWQRVMVIRDGENIIKKKYDEPNSGNKSRIKKKKI